jgi:DNA-binding NtrC family response regulator
MWTDVQSVAKEQLGNTETTDTTFTGRDAARAAGAPTRARSSVLIVDDDAELARRYQRALESYGYVVERASHGEGAVRLAAEKQFDVVVGDIDPSEDREDGTLKRIHAQRKDLPVVLLSGGIAFSTARAAVKCGAYRYLLKPVSEERLLEVLVETIRESPRRPD